MQTDVFRPRNGPLSVPSAMTYGHSLHPDTYPKEPQRPQTQSGYRFGQLSMNAFFTRHNPHPHRVRHIKGLLDVPICAVNDNGFFASPKYDMYFPPNNHDAKKLSGWKNSIPVNAINANSQRLPLDTISGLQNFTGLQNFSHREKSMPQGGMVPASEIWREELSMLTDTLKSKPVTDDPNPGRPKTQYSETTGRLIPPPSRAMTRQASRRARLTPFADNMGQEADFEGMVFTMLCQILQTDDTNAVQAWLCNAPQIEKQKMLELIQSALKSREEYYKQYPTECLPSERPHTSMPAITEGLCDRESSSRDMNRLVLDENMETSHDNNLDLDPRPWARLNATPVLIDQTDNMKLKPRVCDALKTKRPPTTHSKLDGRDHTEGATRLRYTQMSHYDDSTDQAIRNIGVSEWVPEKSVYA